VSGRLPKTKAEWAEAAAAAEACLRIESARLYGFITGGPTIDVARCERVLAGAKRRGVILTAAEVDRAVDLLLRELSHRPPEAAP